MPETSKFRATTYTEPSLVFYREASPRWVLSSDIDRSIEWFGRESGVRGGVYLLREWSAQNSLERMLKGQTQTADRDLTAEVMAVIDEEKYQTTIIRGANFSRSSWVELLAITQRQ